MDIAHQSASLRCVASATDKLVNLMSNFSFSPAPSPHLVPAASFTSLKNRISHSPTPIRKTKSAMLFHKSNTPPVKVPTEISPLKYVLHRAHVRKMEGVSICADKPESDTPPPPSSLLRKGMRNPFAPPSPDRGSGGSTTPAAVTGSPLAK
jgi:serine/arginine repetitive matrix protein 2